MQYYYNNGLSKVHDTPNLHTHINMLYPSLFSILKMTHFLLTFFLENDSFLRKNTHFKFEKSILFFLQNINMISKIHPFQTHALWNAGVSLWPYRIVTHM